MTTKDLLGLLARRWWAVLLGFALLGGAAHLVAHRPGLYFSDANVVLLAPSTLQSPNQLESSQRSLAPLAGVLVRDWNGTHDPLLTGSGSTTLYGEGVRAGVQVRLPNEGSQWAPLFTSGAVNVQVVGDNPIHVAETARAVAVELDTMVHERQQREGVPTDRQVGTIVAPQIATVSYIAPQTSRAELAGLAVALVLTVVLVCQADRRVARRRRSRQEQALAA